MHIKSSLWEIFCTFPSMTSQKLCFQRHKMHIPQAKLTGKICNTYAEDHPRMVPRFAM